MTIRQVTTFRHATVADLDTIIHLLADDDLGATREGGIGGISAEDDEAYRRAFAEIEADPNNELMVACEGEEILGTFQLTFIPNMTFRGGKRAQIEGVRVSAAARGAGIGGAMFAWAIERARAEGCRMVQLTSNKQRPDAIRFYESLGFQSTHVGMKLYL